jgi:hypothetical protein
MSWLASLPGGLLSAFGALLIGQLLVLLAALGESWLSGSEMGQVFFQGLKEPLGWALLLFLVAELPVALVLGTLLTRNRVRSYPRGMWVGGKTAFLIAAPIILLGGCVISLLPTNPHEGRRTVNDILVTVGLATVLVSKETAAGVAGGAIARAHVKRHSWAG